jgi:hypothetical protein
MRHEPFTYTYIYCISTVYQTQEAEGSQPATKIRRNEDVNVHECDVHIT